MTYAGGLLLNGRSDCMKVLCAKKGHCIIQDIAYNNSLAHLALCSLGKKQTTTTTTTTNNNNKQQQQQQHQINRKICFFFKRTRSKLMGLPSQDTHVCEADKTEFKQQRLIVLKCAREQRPYSLYICNHSVKMQASQRQYSPKVGKMQTQSLFSVPFRSEIGNIIAVLSNTTPSPLASKLVFYAHSTSAVISGRHAVTKSPLFCTQKNCTSYGQNSNSVEVFKFHKHTK